MMPSLKLTPGGSAPPSCKYLWTASRPVWMTPEMSTSSPTFSARVFSSVKGNESLIIKLMFFVNLVSVSNGENVNHILLGVKLVNHPMITDPKPAFRRTRQTIMRIICQPQPQFVPFLFNLPLDFLRQRGKVRVKIRRVNARRRSLARPRIH